MKTYTLEEARVIINAENIKEKQRKRVSLRYELKKRIFGVIVLILGIISPFVEGQDAITGQYDLTIFWTLIMLGFFMMINPKFHEKINKEDM